MILAAHVDENVADAHTLDTFRAQTDEILDEVRSGDAPLADDAEDLDDLVRAWSVVMSVALTVTEGAHEGLESSTVAEGVRSLVNEGLVNAVKHSGARSADIEVDRVDDSIIVRISSLGILPVTNKVTGAGVAGIGTRGPQTSLRQVGDRVVLEGVFPVPDPVAAEG